MDLTVDLLRTKFVLLIPEVNVPINFVMDCLNALAPHRRILYAHYVRRSSSPSMRGGQNVVQQIQLVTRVCIAGLIATLSGQTKESCSSLCGRNVEIDV